MVEEGGNFKTDFKVAPNLAENKVLSNTPMIPGSKDMGSLGCNFHFCSGILKDSRLILLFYDGNYSAQPKFVHFE